jgi:hypothetical protein
MNSNLIAIKYRFIANLIANITFLWISKSVLWRAREYKENTRK